ncbi:MAG: hypothetical protein HPY53_01120 [Brevinematales bacterium]|nr:hypothetical protein [Brevinematales bacterium]
MDNNVKRFMNNDPLHFFEKFRFPETKIKYRQGSTYGSKDVLCYAYIESDTYVSTLNEILGPQNWSIVNQEVYPSPLNGTILYSVSITAEFNIDGNIVRRGNVGDNAGSVKTAFTSAFKRTCEMLGLGQYLNDMTLAFPGELSMAPGDNKKRMYPVIDGYVVYPGDLNTAIHDFLIRSKAA